MVRHRRILPRRLGTLMHAVGVALAALALTLQGVLPLADARWHAAHGGLALHHQGAVAAASSGAPLQQQPGAVDEACQFCIALQAPGAAPPATVALAVPVAYRTIAPVLPAPTAPARPATTERPPPRAPPLSI
jgi:hypothetical protein